MNKLRQVALALGVLIALVACGGGSTTPPPAATGAVWDSGSWDGGTWGP